MKMMGKWRQMKGPHRKWCLYAVAFCLQMNKTELYLLPCGTAME